MNDESLAYVETFFSDARRLLDQARTTQPTWRWLIRTDVFDAVRSGLEDTGALITDPSAGEPTLLGLPYDLGTPPGRQSLALLLSFSA